jgi:Ca2+/Na+ antiporter
MDTLFLTIMFLLVTISLLGIAAGIVWVLEHTTWKHVSIGLSFITTVGSIAASIYAYWQAFGWWTFAMVAFAIAHGFYITWYMSNSEKLNQPIYRVGGGRATPRLHR